MPSVTFNYTGAAQTWVVPANVVNVTIEVWGAEGGREVSGVTRRYGGYAKGNLSVTPGETLNLYVGGMPAIGERLGGWNGGGDGGLHQDATYNACGGGGATDVRQGGTALSNRKIVGAGAGGSTGPDANATPPEGVRRGGHGGANTGERGDGVPQAGGGYGGTQSAGGDWGGALGTGGDGEGGTLTNNGVEGSGGGGGGGYYGGGGGEKGPHIENPFGGFDAVQGRGGGGGSNYIGGVTSASSTRGVRAGSGLIKITYTEPPNPPTNVTPVAGATVNTDVPTLGATVQEHPESSTMKSRVEWQLASDSGFTSNVRTITEPTSDLRASGATTETVVQEDQLFQGTWFIRARAIDESGNLSEWTADHSFTVSHPPTTANHSPTGNTTRDYGASGEVTFSWAFSDSSPVDDQTAFEIEVSRNSDGFILLAPGKQASADRSEMLTIPSAEKDTTLRWRIRVWDSDDVVGAWSDYHLFKVSDPPTVSITSPATDSAMLQLDGSAGADTTTPDSTELSVTGDIDLRWFGYFDAMGVTETLASKRDATAGNNSWWLRKQGEKQLYFSIYADGSAATATTIDLPDSVVVDKLVGVRVTWRQSDGRVQWFIANNPEDPVGTTWTQEGVDGSIAVSGIFDSTASVAVGSNGSGGDEFTGEVTAFQMRAGIDGTVVAFPRFDLQTIGATSFADDQGNTWTLNGTAAIVGNPEFGEDVNNAQPTFTWDFVASGGRTQASFRVIVRDEGPTEVHNSGVVSSSATSYQLPDPILENSKTYEVEVRVTDNVNLQGSGTRTFDTVWLPPDAPAATVTDFTHILGYVNISWDNVNQDTDFISYSVYRRVDGGSWKRLVTYTETKADYEYHDWLTVNGRYYEYAVTQTAEVDGDVLESDKNALGPIHPFSDKYWLISESDETLNLQLRHVISDDFSEPYEQQETVVIGRGRHVDEGERQGFSGSLSAQLRDIPDGDTAREQREKIRSMKALQQSVYLRNPFGDLWLVSIGNVDFTRISGVSTREFSDVTIPYSEVA